MRDLTDTAAEIVAAERSRVASEGWVRGCWIDSAPMASGAMAWPRRSGGRTSTPCCSCVVLERRQGAGQWLLDVRHRDTLHEELAGTLGAPNRWITLRARRVLDWFARWDQAR